MKNTRRDFIKAASFGAVGLGLLPNLELFAQGKNISLPRQSPESQGVDSAGIRNFLQKIKASGLEWHSFMLLRHGNVVAEGWWKPFEANNLHTLYSLSKSFTSTAVGFCVNEGRLSVEDQVIKFFPEETPINPSDNLKAMKVKHLLTMNTGHHTDSMPDLRAKPEQSWVKSFLQKNVEHEPSTFFMYNTGATYMLGAIVHKVTGELLETYLKPRLFDPLGIKEYDWEKSPQGLNTAGYGLRVKTEDIAKFGQLYLQKGKWRGKQLLPESWIEEATQKQTTSQEGDNDWSQGYGYQFWRCKPGFYRGDGAFGQFCMVMPQYNAVLAMTCESFNLQQSMNVAYETLLPALKTSPLPDNPNELAALKADLAALSLPVPVGKVSSPLMAKYSNKLFAIEPNPFGITQLGFGLFEDAGVMRVNFGQGIEKIGFGWEKWKVSPNQRKIPFALTPIAITTHIASTATWLNDNTLQINLKFTDQVHGDKLTVSFDDDKVSVTFLSSVAANAKNTPEPRKAIFGMMI